MVDKLQLSKLPKPVAIGLVSTFSVAAIVLATVIAPKICKKMVDNYNESLSVNVAAASIEPAESQTSQTGSSESTTGNGGHDNANHGSDASNVDETTISGETTANGDETNCSSEVTDGNVESSDNPYASVSNVVWDPDKGCYVYLVERGDTLSEISGEVHVSVDRLVEVNSIRDRDLIFTNESIVLP